MTHAPRRRSVLAGLAALPLTVPLAGYASLEALFAPKAEPWDRWAPHDPASTTTLDHGDWADFLAAYRRRGPDGIGRMAYGRVTARDRARLSAYIERLAAARPAALNRAEQMAFWINLYNALTVRVVLDHYPVMSIRDIDISPGFLADGPWGAPLVAVDGTDVSLNDIEHRILRPLWRDPRVHYAVNCASLGCPDLAARPYAAGDLEARLDTAARAYVNHPRGAAVKDGRLVVSSIYVWFGGDFGGDDGVLAHLRQYAEPALAGALAAVTAIGDHRYDWGLNDAP